MSKTQTAPKNAGSAGSGTEERPWVLKTPSGQSEFSLYRDEAAEPPALVVQVGKTRLRYPLRCIEDLVAMFRKHGDWMLFGSVEAWAVSPKNPVGGWYGLKKRPRGRFAMYVPPVLKMIGLTEVEDNPGTFESGAI